MYFRGLLRLYLSTFRYTPASISCPVDPSIECGDIIEITEPEKTGTFVQGDQSMAAGDYSYARGYNCLADGNYSKAEGINAYALSDIQHVSK